MGTRQTFKTADVLKLEVEETPTGLVNLVKNAPDDTGSAWGWVAPVNNTVLGVTQPPGRTDDWLIYNPLPSVANAIYTEDWAQVAGEYAAASLIHAVFSGVTTYIRLRFEWLDATGVVFSSSAQSGYFLGSDVSGGGDVRALGAQLAPAGTVRGRLRIDFYGNTSGGVPGSGSNYFREVTAAKAATAAELTGLGYIDPAGTYTDVLGPTHTITVNRSELNVGTLTAEILDATYDPALNTLIRPGKRCRLLALDHDTGTWQALFAGKVTRGQTTYDPARTDAKRARISLSAVDAAAQLSQVKRPQGVGVLSTLWRLLQGAGVPTLFNGDSTGLAQITYLSNNPDASALDQVAITRDSELGYVWVDRRGRLQVWERTAIGATPAGVLDESVYSGLNVDYDTDRCINVVNVKLRQLNAAGETEEIPYGPYVDQASIDQWGPRAAEFTVQGITATDADVAAYAAPILAANATPAVRINSVDIPIRDAADIVAGKALLDLYDLVTVDNTNAGISEGMRPTGLEHTIEDGRWMLHLDFTVEGSVAAPQQTPSLTPTPSSAPPASTIYIGDMAIVWGSVVLLAGTAETSTAVAFPAGVFAAAPFATGGLTDGGALFNASCRLIATSETAMTVYVQRSTGSGNVRVSWIAIGQRAL